MIAKETGIVVVGRSVRLGVEDQTDVLKREDALVTEMMIVEVVNAALRMELVSGIGAAALDLEIGAISAQTAVLTRGVVAMGVVYVVTSTSWMRLLKRSKLKSLN